MMSRSSTHGHDFNRGYIFLAYVMICYLLRLMFLFLINNYINFLARYALWVSMSQLCLMTFKSALSGITRLDILSLLMHLKSVKSRLFWMMRYLSSMFLDNYSSKGTVVSGVIELKFVRPAVLLCKKCILHGDSMIAFLSTVFIVADVLTRTVQPYTIYWLSYLTKS